MKVKNKQIVIYKIPTSHFKKKNWSIKTDFKKAPKRKETITIGDNQFFRALEEYALENDIITDLQIIEDNKTLSNFISLYDSKKYRFTNSIIVVPISSNKDYDIASKKGLYIDNIKYVEYIGTTGGVKSKNVFYIREDLFEWAWKRLENGRNLNKVFIPNKLQAYMSLDMSVSSLVSQPNKYSVVSDCLVSFQDSVIELGIDKDELPFENVINDYDIELNTNDGFGLITPKFAEVWAEDLGLDYIPSAFIVRNSFCKGVLAVFDYVDYANKKNGNDYEITDVWGNKQNVDECDFILTSSMLKLWDSYEDIEDYDNNCKKNNHKFCITKIQKNKIDNERLLNYQFIQPMELSDEDIAELANPTIDFINGVVTDNYYHRLLFLAGENITEHKIESMPNDFIKALMINEEMMNDPYIINRTKRMIYKKMTETKFGKLAVKGNFTIITGDPYSLCQSMFNQDVTGLLKKGELYSKYWEENEVSEVCALRAPMSSINNIKKMVIVKNSEADYWYRYMNKCSVLNSWDTTSHTLNGLDYDGDLVFTTNNKVFARNIPNSKSIVCIQNSGKKKIAKQSDFHKANKSGFDNKIGVITNKGATMYDLRAKFDKDSTEYLELNKRIRYIQLYQQMEIDALKGIKVSQMPKNWYNYKSISSELDESILAEKKPYFMIYIYNDLKTKYNQHQQKYNSIARRMFGMSLDDLLSKINKTEQEDEISKAYKKYLPVSNENGTMNKICRYAEDKFNKVAIANNGFDKEILKSNTKYTANQHSRIKKLYKDYLEVIRLHIVDFNMNEKDSKDQYNIDKNIIISYFKKKAIDICLDYETLTDIMVDVCYTSDSNKQFCWDICGKQLIRNLINNKEGEKELSYLTKNKEGDIIFNGNKFILKKYNLN